MSNSVARPGSKKPLLLFLAGVVSANLASWLFGQVKDEVLFNTTVTFDGEGCKNATLKIGDQVFTTRRMTAALPFQEYPVLLEVDSGEGMVGLLDLSLGEAYIHVDCDDGTVSGNGVRSSHLFTIKQDSMPQ